MQADQKNAALARLVTSRAAKVIRKAKGKKKRKLITASNKVSDRLAAVLDASAELPLVEVSCEAASTCTEVNDSAAAKAYRSKSKLLITAARSLASTSTPEGAARDALLTSIGKLAGRINKAAKKVPSKSFSCPSGLGTGSGTVVPQ